MFRNLAFFGERICTHGDSVFAEVVFNHACDGLVLAGTSARTKVGTDSVCGVTIFAAAVAVAFGTVQPVVNGHGNFFERTIAEYARVARKLRRNVGLVALHPNGVRKCRHGIERYFACDHRFFSHHALGAHVIQANGLLEVDVEILFGSVDGRLEPATIIVKRSHCRHGIAVHEQNRIGIRPRRKEHHCLFCRGNACAQSGGQGRHFELIHPIYHISIPENF